MTVDKISEEFMIVSMKAVKLGICDKMETR